MIGCHRWIAPVCTRPIKILSRMATRLKAAVIGVGHLGREHARVYASLESAELVAVCDIDEAAGQAVAQRFGVAFVKDFGDLIFRRGRAVPGIVLMRVASETPRLQDERLMLATERYGERLFGQYLVIEEARFRSRQLWDGP